MHTFADHFCKQAKQYAYYRYRPHYPAELFTYLSGLCKEQQYAAQRSRKQDSEGR